MGQLGFSYMGFAFLIMLMVPNLIWTRHKPDGYEAAAARENRVLLAFECVGEALVTCMALAFSNLNPRTLEPWTLWLVLAVLCMLLYEIYWIRYFRSAHTMRDFYASLLGIPVAGATLPVAAFALLAIYGRSLWLLLAVAILGVGHIGIHLQHLGEIRMETKEKEPA